jgi:arginase
MTTPTASFVVVPQWQGSVSTRAMQLVDGTTAISSDLPASSTHTVEIPLEAGDELGTGISRCGSLRLVADRQRKLLAGVKGVPITIGGDCGVSLAAIDHAMETTNGDLAVVWFDAHPDLNTAVSSPSGAFGGMVLRALTGDGVDGLVPATPLDPAKVVLAGTRSIDPGEDDYLAEHGMTPLLVEQLSSPALLLAAIAGTGAGNVYVHIDVDVVDPADISGVSDPVPFGLPAASLLELLRAVKDAYPLAGATIAGFSPASPEAAGEDMPTILRVIAALTA